MFSVKDGYEFIEGDCLSVEKGFFLKRSCLWE
jgi:hypothetical protein